jgi:agmatine/peptidylarginine deiminase
MTQSVIFPAEWQPQSAVQLTWPHEGTDWKPSLDAVIPCFKAIAEEVAKRELLLIAAPDEREVRRHLAHIDPARIIFRRIDTNDTWARDHGGIAVWKNGQPVLCDFLFNGWGLKYPANLDNLITRRLFDAGTFAPQVQLDDRRPFVLEGGSIDSNGQGVLLTTTACLASPNRNEHLTAEQIDNYLKETFGARQILRLDSGYLEGDDTDAHVDTLARFCSPDAIAYVQCTDPADAHYPELRRMEDCLRSFRQPDGQPYHLLPLPMADKVVERGERLPATYANFLVINDAVLYPCYRSPKDSQAADVLHQAFPGRDVIGIDSLPLIRQHGSLHCVAMQYPEHFINPPHK